MGGESKDALLASLRGRFGDGAVTDAIAAVPRPAFVRPADRDRAWEDCALPFEHGQTISQPQVVAQMCALLEIAPGDRVLDVGTGSGYHAAVLAALGARVWSIERDPALTALAAEALARAGVTGVALVVGDGSLGHPPAAPYDAINVAAAAPGRIPPALEDQLAQGGRLVVPVEERLVLARRSHDGARVEHFDAGAVRFVPLVGEG
jgi:protein-L-isoaspartate(D-aspartate) O-methyltransferase